MVTLCGRRIKFSYLLAHLVSGDLAGGTEKGGESFGCCSHGLLNLILSMYVEVW
jgi:hypothetical protein